MMGKGIDKGFTLWLTGLPCSGKTTLAKMAEEEMSKRGIKAELLDGEMLREGCNQDLGFSKEDRDTNVRRVGFIAHLLSRNGVVAIASVLSPYRAIREEMREMIGEFVEVYVQCPLDVCIKRDVNGLYKLALAGEIKNFTGISDPYEAPIAPEILVDTDKKRKEECVSIILNRLEELGYISKKAEGCKECMPEEDIYSIEDEEKIKKRLQALGYI